MADASDKAYAAVCYLRTVENGKVSVQLLAAKSRVAPTKPLTIPRKELLAAVIASRLAKEIKTALNMQVVKEYYWSDSTTVIAWIKRDVQWGTFVGNRTIEINNLTNKDDWYHLPGKSNPADLPSRGCSPGELAGNKWFEGPEWLREDKLKWPTTTFNYNEEEIAGEQKKHSVKTVMANACLDFTKAYKYRTIVRIQAWVRRFVDNTRHKKNKRGPLTFEEISRAETDVLLKIQHDCFGDTKGKARLKTLESFYDEHGVIRTKTRLTSLNEDKNYKFLVILPGEHAVVQQLIKDTHESFCHAGVGFLMVTLRRNYWIIKSRQTIKKFISRCVRCRKYSAKGTVTPTAPHDRIRNAEVFEVVGVDSAGPFLVKNGKKVWIVLYTCAVCRAVHLQVITSLSTNEFVKSLQKFVEKYRRPAVIYSDNGTNFKGAYNLFRSIDWQQIQQHEETGRVEWRFNPPTAAWWGGWWERLIRTMKDLLRKEIARAIISQKELAEVVKVVEEVMNDRPLTYISEDVDDLEPLTPSLFLHPFGNIRFPEAEFVDGENLRSRYTYLKAMQRELRIRFKKEYIALLISRNPKAVTRSLKVGELVVVGHDNRKRTQWPLGRVLELFPGKDGVARVAKVKTGEGILTRPVQRLYALEADRQDAVCKTAEVRTRSGRVVRPTNNN